MRFSRIGKNARFGDGSIRAESKNAHVSFYSTDLEWLKFKKQLADEEQLLTNDFGTQASGYGGTKTIYNFRSRVHESLTKVYKASTKEVIDDLDELDLFMWFVDDGSWHKSRNTMHLYCNMFNDLEVKWLSDKIEDIYGVRPTKRLDRKRDGRQFNYLYFPRWLVAVFRPRFKEFLVKNNLTSLYYKFGGIDYKDHLEQIVHLRQIDNFDAAYNGWAAARRSDKSATMTFYDGHLFVNYIYKGQPKQKIYPAHQILGA